MSVTKKSFGINCLYFLGLLAVATFISFLGVAIVGRGFERIADVGYMFIPMIGLVFVLLSIIHIYSVWIIRPSYKKFSRLREYLIIICLSS